MRSVPAAPAMWPLLAAMTLLGSGACGSSNNDYETCTPGPNPVNPATPTAAENSEARALLNLVNAARASLDPPVDPVVWSDTAARIAFDHSCDMMERGFFDNVNPNCWGVVERAIDAGIDFLHIAENEAIRKGDPIEVFDAWFRTAGTRVHILDARFTHMGVGKHSGPGGPWWTQVFYEAAP